MAAGWCRTPGWGYCASWQTRPGCQRRSRRCWPIPTRGRGPTPRVRCSPIWPPLSLTGRTASTPSGSCAGIASTSSGRRPPRPRCGGWLTSASTPRTCRRSAAAWAAGAGPPAGRPLYIDIDATLVIDHSDNKQHAAPTWKKSFGHRDLTPCVGHAQSRDVPGGSEMIQRDGKEKLSRRVQA